MAEATSTTDEVAKSRKGLLVALVGVVLVALAGTGVAYTMGLGPFATDEPELVEQPTAKPTDESAEESAVVPVAAAATVPRPPADAQESMYWEQVASGDTIAELVADKFATLELSQIATAADKADIRVQATYRDGSALNGWLLLRQYEGAWYFASITRDGNSVVTPVSGTADADVVKAIVEQQALNQDIYQALLSGGHQVITITRVTAGSGTAMLDITLSGGSAAEAKGQITCISKNVNGSPQWFITAFSTL